METIPLLKKLSEWGVKVDCYLSSWQDSRKRLDDTVKTRVAPYVDIIFSEGLGMDLEIRARKYDVLIVSPGPTVNELGMEIRI